MIYLIRFRPFSIEDVAVARLARPFAKAPSSMQFNKLSKPFEQVNCLIDLKPEDEYQFIKTLVETHPEHVRDFEHFLIDPPANILPSQILQELQTRSNMIPTLAYMKVLNGEIRELARVNSHNELSRLLNDASERGWIPLEICHHLIGSRKNEKEVIVND